MKGLSISTYEISGKKEVLTLTHVFWGKTIEEAAGVAKAHMKADRFFKASLTGTFPWQGMTIHLVNKHTGQVEGLCRVKDNAQVQRAIQHLKKQVLKRAAGGNGGLRQEYVANVFYVI